MLLTYGWLLTAIMKEQGMKRDIHTDTVLLTAFMNGGEYKLAQNMLSNVYRYPPSQRSALYTAYISALAQTRNVSLVCMAYDSFRDMVAEGIVPHKRTVRVDAMSCIVNLRALLTILKICALINALTHLNPMRVKEATYLFELMDQ
jgi:hypothetical protein